MTKIGNTEQIKTMEFVEVVSDKKLKDYGIERGDVLLVAGFKEGQDKHDDPYALRKYAVVVKVINDSVALPAQGNDNLSYVIDPRSVKPVGPVRQKYYEDKLRADYGQ